jgi:hypothetical protein
MSFWIEKRWRCGFTLTYTRLNEERIIEIQMRTMDESLT